MAHLLAHLYESMRDGLLRSRKPRINPNPFPSDENLNQSMLSMGFYRSPVGRKSVSVLNEYSEPVETTISFTETIKCTIRNRIAPSDQIIYSKNLAQHNERVQPRDVLLSLPDPSDANPPLPLSPEPSQISVSPLPPLPPLSPRPPTPAPSAAPVHSIFTRWWRPGGYP